MQHCLYVFTLINNFSLLPSGRGKLMHFWAQKERKLSGKTTVLLCFTQNTGKIQLPPNFRSFRGCNVNIEGDRYRGKDLCVTLVTVEPDKWSGMLLLMKPMCSTCLDLPSPFSARGIIRKSSLKYSFTIPPTAFSNNSKSINLEFMTVYIYIYLSR